MPHLTLVTRASAILLAGVTLVGCAASPLGPTVLVMPGPGRTFESFAADQAGCKGYAGSQVQGQAEAANTRAIGGGVLSTVLGAGLGAAIGGGRGAGIGAAGGALLGGGLGAGSTGNEQGGIQAQYDNAFAQCMYSKGHDVPGFAPHVAAAGAYGSTSYRQGSVASPLVGAVQGELSRLNLLGGPPDGVPGPRTARAIATYERGVGLPVTGQATPDLLARLQATPTGAGLAAAGPVGEPVAVTQ